MSLKGIKRMVNYGLISLTGFNLFVGCSSPFEPDELSTIESNTNSIVDLSLIHI